MICYSSRANTNNRRKQKTDEKQKPTKNKKIRMDQTQDNNIGPQRRYRRRISWMGRAGYIYVPA